MKFLGRMSRINVLTDEKQKNAGMSLVEILVVFAIVGLLIGVGVGAWAVLKSADVSKSSKNISSYYEKLKSTTMSKTGDWNMKITRDDNDMYYVAMYNGNVMSGEKAELGKYIDIYFKDENDGSLNKITKDSPLIIKLKASTGGVSEITYGSTKKYSSAEGSSSTYGSIQVWLGDSRSKEIKIYYVTGRAVKN